MGEEEARAFCATLTDAAGMARLDRLSTMLAQENARQNLVSAASLNAVWDRHMADSLQLLLHVPRGTMTWLDLGTGAGFPGLAIAATRPDMHVALVESRRKRIAWLEHAVRELGLPHCQVIGARLEDVPSFPVDVISARAFAPLERLLGLSARFSTRDSLWLLPKGRSAEQELSEQPAQIRAMFHVEQSRTDPLAGILIGRGEPALL